MGLLKRLSETVAARDARSVLVVGTLSHAEAMLLSASLSRATLVTLVGAAALHAAMFRRSGRTVREVTGPDLESLCREAQERGLSYDYVIAVRLTLPPSVNGVEGAVVASQAVSMLLAPQGLSAVVGSRRLGAKLSNVKEESEGGETLLYCTRNAPADCPCRRKR